MTDEQSRITTTTRSQVSVGDDITPGVPRRATGCQASASMARADTEQVNASQVNMDRSGAEHIEADHVTMERSGAKSLSAKYREHGEFRCGQGLGR